MPMPQCLCCVAQLFEMQNHRILTAEFQNKENKEGQTHGTEGVLNMRLTDNRLKIFMQNTTKTGDSIKIDIMCNEDRHKRFFSL